jgi:hypothetical protein
LLFVFWFIFTHIGTTYGEGYHRDDELIRRFWRVVNQFDETKKKLFLAFTTGSDRSPIGGLKV